MSALSFFRNVVPVTPDDTAYLSDAESTSTYDATQASTVVNTTTEVITIVGHGYNNGDRLLVVSAGDCGGIATGDIVYVINKTTDTFKIAASIGGAAINLTGTVTVFPTFARREIYNATTPETGFIYVGVAGDVCILPVGHKNTNTATEAANGPIVFKNVPAGTWLLVEAKKVFATTTTATNLKLGYK